VSDLDIDVEGAHVCALCQGEGVLTRLPMPTMRLCLRHQEVYGPDRSGWPEWVRHLVDGEQFRRNRLHYGRHHAQHEITESDLDLPLSVQDLAEMIPAEDVDLSEVEGDDWWSWLVQKAGLAPTEAEAMELLSKGFTVVDAAEAAGTTKGAQVGRRQEAKRKLRNFVFGGGQWLRVRLRLT